MVCQACGAAITEEVRFCPKCGAQITAAPPVYGAYPPPTPAPMYAPMYAPAPRVQRNLQTLGILWCVFGVYRIMAGLIGMFFFRAMFMHRFGGEWFYRVRDCCGSGAGVAGGVESADAQAVGQDACHHCCDPVAAEVSVWDGSRYLHAVGPGSGGLWSRV